MLRRLRWPATACVALLALAAAPARSSSLFVLSDDLDTGNAGFVTRASLDGRQATIGLPWTGFVSRVSPDGRALAAIDLRRRRIVVSRMSFRRHSIASRTIASVSGPVPGALAWSADGRRLAFLAKVRGRIAFWSVPADGSAKPRFLAPGPTRGRWSPGDGPSLSLSWCRCGELTYAADLGEDAGIETIDIARGTRRLLTRPQPNPHPEDPRWVSGSDGQPVWSPDGRRLMFMRTAPEDGGAIAPPPDRLMALDRRTGRLRAVRSEDALSIAHVAWSPGSDRIGMLDNYDPATVIRARDGRFVRRVEIGFPGSLSGLSWSR